VGIAAPGRHITSGTEHFKPQRFEGGGMRFLRFKRWLNELLSASDHINAVFFEEVRRHAGVDAAHAYGGFMGHLTAWCEHHNIPYQGVPVGTIKKHATGKGNAGKDEMIASVRLRGHTPSTTTKPTRWPCCTGPSRHRRCDMKVPTPNTAAPGSSAAAGHGSGRDQGTWLARPAHPGGQRIRRTSGLHRTRDRATHR
jgi:hypothetical protein